jgi:uncharacterized protein
MKNISGMDMNLQRVSKMENLENKFISLLWQFPGHWFSEVNNGVRVMDPISYALHQAFEMRHGSDFEDEMLLPIFYKEKKKYQDLLQTKKAFSSGKSIFGMIHLSADETDGTRIQRAIEEMQILEEEGVNGIIVENYHGSTDDVREFFKVAQPLLEKTKLIIGLNILPNEYEEAFKLADEVGAKFIQLDYVSGTYFNSKFIYEPHYLEVREKYPHIAVMGGVWPKYYRPVVDSSLTKEEQLKKDIQIAIKRADAIVVTGEGTGKQTPMDKISEFKKILKDFPLIVGAGLTPETVGEQLKIANGAIVGSTFKPAGVTTKKISRELVKKFMDEVKKLK